MARGSLCLFFIFIYQKCKLLLGYNERCQILNTFFIKHYGTAEPKKLQDIIESTGPIILGSNTCYGFTVIEPITKEILLSAYIENGKLLVNAIFRDERGIKQLEITPNIKPVFFNATLTVSCGGKGGIVLGNNSFNHFMVGNDDGIRLAARATHTGRVVFFKAKLYALDFKRYININKDLLTLKGVVLS